MKSTRIESRPVADLRRADYNPRRISDRAMSGLRESVTRFGLVQPIIVNERTGCVVGGHQRLRVLEGEGVAETDVVVVDLDEAEERALNVALNNPHISGEFTDDLDDLLQRIVADTPDLFDALRLDDLLDDAIQVVEPAGGGVDDHGVLPDDPTSPASTPGDLWLLGDHRILCGDATSEESVQGLLDGTDVDLILTDPPYCSGGFQEAGKSRGSVGTTSVHKHVANDRLSTRGYAALLRRAFAVAGGDYIYAFTDWRMWVHLFDIVEGSGYGVRSMIVWDKGHPGMGRGWRSQHELIMWGCRSTPPFDKHASGGGQCHPGCAHRQPAAYDAETG